MSSSLIDTYSLSSIEKNSLLLSRVRTIVKFYIWPLLVVFGLTGNCLSILVLTRRRLIRTSTNNYLTILAVFDSCYLIISLMLNFASSPRFSQYSLTQTISNMIRPMADFSSNTATWLIVCFTLERTLAVAKPIYAKRTCSVRRSRHVICGLLISCFVVTLPTFFESSLVHDNYAHNINYNLTQSNNLTKRKELFLYLHRLYLVFICVVIIWIPLIVLCVCNSILIWYVHRSRNFDDDIHSTNSHESYRKSSASINIPDYSPPANRKSSSISSLSSNPNAVHLRRHNRSIIQKRRVTIILIFCLFVALLLWTPQSLSLTYETFIENYSEMSHNHRIILLIFNNFANLFLCINASIDLILYCFLSEKFARTCKQIMCRQCSINTKQNGQRPRLLSLDRTSFIAANPSANHYQQQLAANTTNKYYIQLYDFYRNSSGLKKSENKNWKKKFVHSITTNNKSDNHIFYQERLAKNMSKSQSIKSSTAKTMNVISNPVLSYIDEKSASNEIHDSMKACGQT